MEKKKLALMGCGYLGNIVARAYVDGLLPGYQLVGVASRSYDAAQKTAQMAGCPACRTLQELLALGPDHLAEAASVQCVRDIALPTLHAGVNLVVLSIGAFADLEFLAQAEAAAAHSGARVHLASGAIGGFDVLQTITLMAQAQGLAQSAGIHTHKGPASLQGTPLFAPQLAEAEQEVFCGSAAQAIELLPTKVNVAVAAALATTGPRQAGMRITSVPGFVGDDHRITAEIEGVKAMVDVYSSTSAIAGWSVVALLRNLAAPIAFY